MAIGERIKHIRNLKNFTQKYLGQLIGFPEKTADIRIAQYESGTRTPKADITKELAKALFVSESAISKWEKGVSYPDITLLPKLSKILGVSIKITPAFLYLTDSITFVIDNGPIILENATSISATVSEEFSISFSV